jgi:hypothetical protein
VIRGKTKKKNDTRGKKKNREIHTPRTAKKKLSEQSKNPWGKEANEAIAHYRKKSEHLQDKFRSLVGIWQKNHPNWSGKPADYPSNDDIISDYKAKSKECKRYWKLADHLYDINMTLPEEDRVQSETKEKIVSAVLKFRKKYDALLGDYLLLQQEVAGPFRGQDYDFEGRRVMRVKEKWLKSTLHSPVYAVVKK